MLAAIVTDQQGRREFHLEGVRADRNSLNLVGPVALIRVDTARKSDTILPRKGEKLMDGFDGVRQCLRFIATQCGRTGAETAVEWWPELDRKSPLGRRLFGMAGGLVAAAQLEPEKRKERAAKAASARYTRPIPPLREEVAPGVLVEARAVREEHGQWVVRAVLDGDLLYETTCRSRRHAVEMIEFAGSGLGRLWRIIEPLQKERKQAEAPAGG